MPKVIKTIAIILSSIVILFFAALFLKNFSKVSVTEKNIEIKSEKIENAIEIKYNNFGVPHIYANSDNDMFFGIGYSHAENRLWQMDLSRRIAGGELSEILGNDYILADKFMRGMNLKSISNLIYKQMPSETRQVLISYTNGINAYLEKNQDNLPLEFSILNYQPKKWEPIDCILIQRYVDLQMCSSLISDIILGEMSEKIGPENTKLLLPNFDSSKKFSPIYNTLNHKFFIKDTLLHNSLFSDLRKTFEQTGLDNFSGGSNSWAIRKKTKNAFDACLANDIHLPLTLPSEWMQIRAFSDNMNLTGMTFPGIPFVIIGRNDRISWGYTNMKLDGIDYFKELISADGKKYLGKDSILKPIKFEIDTIKIKQKNPIRYYRRSTEKSTIISDYHIIDSRKGILKNMPNSKIGKYSLTYRWVGTQLTDELTALFLINKSKNWNDFTSALRNWGSPAVFFQYADVDGNIGIIPAGLVPVRGAGNIPFTFNKSWVSQTDWLGFKSTNDLKQLFNPQSNFVSSANNYFSDSSAKYISYLFDNHSRIYRINDFLFKLKDFELRDMKNMQQDKFSRYAEEVMKFVLPVLKDSKQFMNEKEKKVFNELERWDFNMTANKYAPSVFNLFILKMINNTFYDELSDEFYKKYTYVSSIAYNKILELLESNSTLFFDNRYTEQIENSKFVIFQSFRDAVKSLEEATKKSNPEDWTWGKFHRVIIKHPLSNNKYFQSTFDISPIELGGSWSSIYFGSWDFAEPFDVKEGVSLRFIADMQDSTVYSVIAGGISGDPTSIHYSNQIRIWANGGYFKLFHSRNKIISSNSRIIIPSNK